MSHYKFFFGPIDAFYSIWHEQTRLLKRSIIICEFDAIIHVTSSDAKQPSGLILRNPLNICFQLWLSLNLKRSMKLPTNAFNSKFHSVDG